MIENSIQSAILMSTLYQIENDRWPTRGELDAYMKGEHGEEDDGFPRDPDSGDFLEYRIEKDQVIITYLGKDGKVGGTGKNADLELRSR